MAAAGGRGSHGYRERFLIEKQFGHWTLQPAFIDSAGRTAGASSGSDFSFSGGTLTYTENYRKKPHDTWDDRCSFTIQSAEGDGEVFSVGWVTANGRAGTLALVREE